MKINLLPNLRHGRNRVATGEKVCIMRDFNAKAGEVREGYENVVEEEIMKVIIY
jgi:hypothetical protein